MLQQYCWDPHARICRLHAGCLTIALSQSMPLSAIIKQRLVCGAHAGPVLTACSGQASAVARAERAEATRDATHIHCLFPPLRTGEVAEPAQRATELTQRPAPRLAGPRGRPIFGAISPGRAGLAAATAGDGTAD